MISWFSKWRLLNKKIDEEPGCKRKRSGRNTNHRQGTDTSPTMKLGQNKSWKCSGHIQFENQRSNAECATKCATNITTGSSPRPTTRYFCFCNFHFMELICQISLIWVTYAHWTHPILAFDIWTFLRLLRLWDKEAYTHTKEQFFYPTGLSSTMSNFLSVTSSATHKFYN